MTLPPEYRKVNSASIGASPVGARNEAPLVHSLRQVERVVAEVGVEIEEVSVSLGLAVTAAVRRGRGGQYVGLAPLMWLFLAGSGLDLPSWGVGLAIAAYGALLSVPAVLHNCRSAWSRPEGIAWPSGTRAKAQRAMSTTSPCSVHAAPRCWAKCQGLYG